MSREPTHRSDVRAAAAGAWFELPGVAAFASRADGTVGWMSRAATELLRGPGAPPVEATSVRWRDWVVPEDRDLLPDGAGEARVRVRTADGTARWVQLVLTTADDAVVGVLHDVHDLVTVSEQLAARDAEYRLLADNASEVVGRVDAAGVVREISGAIGRLTGHRAAQLVDQPLTDLVHDIDRPAVAEALQGLSTAADPTAERGRTFAVRLRRADGRLVWVEAQLRRVPAPTAGDVQLQVVLGDITARRWAEEELGRQEQLLRTVTEATPVGIFAMRGTVWTFVNARMSEIVGLDSTALLDGELLDHLHPDDQPAFRRLLAEVRRGRVAHGLYRLHRPDGQLRWVRVRVVGTEDGEAGLVGSVEDTTNETAARQHADLLATIIASTTDLVVVHEPDGTVRFLNAAGHELLGHPPDWTATTRRAEDLYGAGGWAALQRAGIATAAREGAWTGEAVVVTADGTTLPVSVVVIAHRDPSGRLERVSVVARDVRLQKAREARLARQATRDQLTGLPNRSSFHDAAEAALARASRSGNPVAVLFCDLDRFKVVNDSLGHAAGDQLLCEAATRISGVLRTGDVAARLGGDEFCILCHDLTGDVDAGRVAERVHQVLSEPFVLDGEEIHLSASIGVAISEPGIDVSRLMSRADQAMYRAKRLGRSRTCWFDAAAPRSGQTALEAERELRRAIEGGQLQLRYQPIVRLGTGRLMGCEALVRWPHPTRGLLHPRDFIPLAEESGLIVPLGEWVLRTAIGQAATWRDRLPEPGSFRLAVNLSLLEVQREGVAEMILTLLADAGLPPETLVVELTERSLRPDRRTGEEIAALRERGVGLAVDDFGTGYSSLARLKQLPATSLKIGSVFVAGIGDSSADTAIVTSIVRLARALRMTSIAEGVQTETQRTWLESLGCDAAQGYLFSEPLSADEVGALLDAEPEPALPG